MAITKEQLLASAQNQLEKVRQVRRHLHAHPELSFQEHETAYFLQARLEEAGIEVKTGYAETGLVAVIKGKNPDSRLFALRGDMDALPIKEENTIDYRSQNEGVMHACGHDVHSACALGAGLILQELKDEWEGTVHILFQPGEEKLPGGASLMIRDGALNPLPKGIVGQHVFPELPAGKVGFKPGMYMASADEIYITLKGKGGHAALPHKNKDAIAAMAQMITGLQQVVSRMAPPAIPCVLSFGKVIANGATNVIPNEVYIEGTFRTMDEAWRAEAHDLIRKVGSKIAGSFGVEADVDVRMGYPYVENDPALTMSAMDAAKELLGADNVVDLEIRMTGEDFAYYSQHMPGCFYRLGTSSPDGKQFTSPVHTPTFDIDEHALLTGTALMAWLAMKC